MNNSKKLIVILGPTGIGKTALSIELAKHFSTDVISADSRQIYRGIPIITATPDEHEMKAVRHHLIDCKPLDAYYSASLFEQDALKIANELFKTKDFVVVAGGSMMYIDALCNGIDDIPTISHNVRQSVKRMLSEHSVEQMFEILKALDPEYAKIVDANNLKRIAHAIEICLESGKTFTSLRTGTHKAIRPFDIIKIGLNTDRTTLFERINTRVLTMMESGALQEAKSVYHLRNLNSLNTVGFKELFKYLDGEWSLDTAIARIQKNTRVYAKKQLTWFKRDSSINWLDPVKTPMPEALNQVLNTADVNS